MLSKRAMANAGLCRIATLALFAACADSPTTATQQQAEEFLDIPDNDCRIVLRHVEQDVVSLGIDESLVFKGEIDVKNAIAATGLAHISYRSNMSHTIGMLPSDFWTSVTATEIVSVGEVYTRIAFRMDHSIFRAGAVTGESWKDFVLLLIPNIEGEGQRFWDHNFPNVATESNPHANYLLQDDLNDFVYVAPADICP